MNRFFALGVIVLTALMLSSCAKEETKSGAKHATVALNDGTTTAGNVVSTSDKEIVVEGDDKVTRTIPMDQVRSIQYNDVAQATPAAEPGTTSAPAAADQANTPESARELQPKYELPVGTKVAVRTFETIDSATSSEGHTFPGEVTKNVVDGTGKIVIPARSNVEIVIKSASKGGRFRGTSDLVLDLKSVTIGGKRYGIETAAISKVGKQGLGANKRTATYTGGGAALGAIIGAIAGGGKGAAIGAVSGAGAGAATQTITKGGSIKVPAETILTFQLDHPLRIGVGPR
jgi:hypothetical protein